MGLGGFLAAKGDAEHYESELRREENEICEVPEREAEEIVDLFKDYGVTASEAAPVVAALRREPKAWRDFMMRFELGLEAPDPKRALRSALTIAGSYVIGGMIPLLPYMLAANAQQALMVSIAVTLLALALFGFVKGHFTGVSKFKSAWQTALVGSLAAGVAFAIAKAISLAGQMAQTQCLRMAEGVARELETDRSFSSPARCMRKESANRLSTV